VLHASKGEDLGKLKLTDIYTKGVYALFTGQRKREREKEGVFAYKRNDGCQGTFYLFSIKE